MAPLIAPRLVDTSVSGPALQFWTDFADGSVMFPIGIAVAILLALFGHRRTALAWTAAIGAVWTVMLVLKFAGYAWAAIDPSSPLHTIDLVTPSGHVASSTMIYGGLVALLLHKPGALRPRALLAGLLVAVGIGLTRVLLDDHSTAEVVAGGIVGLGGLLLLTGLTHAAVAGWARPILLASAALVIVVMHGTHTTWEYEIYRLSLRAATAIQGG